MKRTTAVTTAVTLVVSVAMTLCSLPGFAQSNGTPTPDGAIFPLTTTVTPTPKDTPIEVVDPVTPTPTPGGAIDVPATPVSDIVLDCEIAEWDDSTIYGTDTKAITCTSGEPYTHTVEATIYYVSGSVAERRAILTSGAGIRWFFSGDFTEVHITDNDQLMYVFRPSDVARVGDGATLEVYLPLVAR